MNALSQKARSPGSVSPSGAPTDKRIDAAHIVAGSSSAVAQSEAPAAPLVEVPAEPLPNASLLAAAAGKDPGHQDEQMRSQALELAGHLRSKQQDLDRREAELNALAAKLESEQRTSRLWLRERAHEFAERENALRQTIVQLEERAAGVSAAQVSIDRDSDEARRTTQDFSERERRFQESEALLESHHAQLAADRRQLESEREQFAWHMRDERQAAAERQEQAEAELRSERQALKQRAESLDQREQAALQLQVEVTRMHRETLELRLVAEELWTQLAGAAAPTELTQSLGRVRARLAAHYRLEEETLSKQREELAQLALKLDQRQRELREQRAAMHAWHADRQEEIEQQAARLVAREQELDLQERNYRSLEQKSAVKRREEQKELRRLMAQLR